MTEKHLTGISWGLRSRKIAKQDKGKVVFSRLPCDQGKHCRIHFHHFPSTQSIKFLCLPFEFIFTTPIPTQYFSHNKFSVPGTSPSLTPDHGHLLVHRLCLHFPSSSTVGFISTFKVQWDYHLLREIFHERPIPSHNKVPFFIQHPVYYLRYIIWNYALLLFLVLVCTLAIMSFLMGQGPSFTCVSAHLSTASNML